MNRKLLLCGVSNFIYSILMYICSAIIVGSVYLGLKYFTGEYGTLIILGILLTICLMYTSFNQCRNR